MDRENLIDRVISERPREAREVAHEVHAREARAVDVHEPASDVASASEIQFPGGHRTSTIELEFPVSLRDNI